MIPREKIMEINFAPNIHNGMIGINTSLKKLGTSF